MSDIVKITQNLNNPDNLKNDINTALSFMEQHFTKKYLEPMNNLYLARRNQCRENPTPEIALLQACKPFMKNKNSLDSIISGLNSFNAISGIINDYSNTIVSIQSENDSCIHSDGVYEVDKECVKASTQKNDENDISILLALLIFMLINRA